MLQGLQHVVGADRQHAAAAPTGDVPEGVREKRFADADRTDDRNVRMRLEKPQRRELIEQRAIEGHLRGRIPGVEVHGGIEARALHAQGDSQTIAARRLVAEYEQQEIVVRHLLLAGEEHPLGQGVEHASELQATEHGFQIRADDFSGRHSDSPSEAGRSATGSGKAY